ncbi:hypothetical protein [Streptomyces sp. MAR4 CNX-425]|uniref:hypothetical protein n=1 Tax=Streptomyces sp. MAR4 CNX-425 TaxID=3406343 RepID=UPI003B510660
MKQMTWTERVRHFERTAPKSRLLAAGFALGATMCALYAPLFLTTLTREDALSYAIGLPFLAIGSFAFLRLRAFARQWVALLFLIFFAMLLIGFWVVSEDRILDVRGERTAAVVVETVPQVRSGTTYKLAKPNGEHILGELSGGPFDVGDRVEVVVDPVGRADPVLVDGQEDSTSSSLRFALTFGLICVSLLVFTTWGAASVYENHRRSRASPLPSHPIPPPPPPPGTDGFGPTPPPP